jgi:hypothetical protein
MVYGRSGSGKSSTWASLAQWIADTDTNSHVHLGDSDNAYSAIGHPDIEPVVTASHITDYTSALQWARKTRDNVSRDDWVIADMIDKFWPWAQEYFFKLKYGDDDLMLGDVYLQNHIDMDKPVGERGTGMAGAHGSNWGDIYKFYHGLLNMVLNMPCHVLGVAACKEIRKDTQAAVIAQYKDVGFYPAGPSNDNELAHNFHSVIYCAETPRDWRYTSIKEMGPINKPKRAMMKGVKVDDFVVTYLMKVGDWKI